MFSLWCGRAVIALCRYDKGLDFLSIKVRFFPPLMYTKLHRSHYTKPRSSFLTLLPKKTILRGFTSLDDYLQSDTSPLSRPGSKEFSSCYSSPDDQRAEA